MPDEVYKADTQTSTGTAVPSAGGDNHIPTTGSVANWGSITSETFLAGPKPGQEQVLVKVGNQTAKVSEGQRLEEIQKRHWFKLYDTATENGDFEFDQHRKSTVTLSDTLNVGEDQFVTVGRDQSVGTVRDQKVLISRDQTVSVTRKRNVNAREIEEYGKEKITIQAGVELLIQGPGGSIKIDRDGVTIQGVLVKIN
jgi:hypothetical protein